MNKKIKRWWKVFAIVATVGTVFSVNLVYQEISARAGMKKGFTNPNIQDDFDQTPYVLVLYNTNTTDGLTLANYYKTARSLDSRQICGVDLPPGDFARLDHLRKARDQVLDCICDWLDDENGLGYCNPSTWTLSDYQDENPVRYLAIVGGFPLRINEIDENATDWWHDDFATVPSEVGPIFPMYLSGSLFRDEFFASSYNGANFYVDGTESVVGVTKEQILPRLDQTQMNYLPWGLIRGLDTASGKDLIDRIIDAEDNGYTGKIFTDSKTNITGGLQADFWETSFNFLGKWGEKDGSQYCHAMTQSQVDDFVAGTGSNLWANCSIRSGWEMGFAGESNPIRNGHYPCAEDSSQKSLVPSIKDLWIMNVDSNGPSSCQIGFDGVWDDILNYEISGGGGQAQLCENHTNPTTCRKNSHDYFQVLNSDRVSLAPGAMGFVYRSWPVMDFALFPKGYGTAPFYDGDIKRSIPREASEVVFGSSSNTYLTYQAYNAVSSPLCPDGSGGTVSCNQQILVDLVRHLPDTGETISKYEVSFKVRNKAANSNGVSTDLEVLARNVVSPQRFSQFISFASDRTSWTTVTATLETASSGVGMRPWVQIRGYETELEEYFDIDDLEIKAYKGPDTAYVLVDTVSDDMESLEYDGGPTNLGDWAANFMMRLGAVAFWGSGAHHLDGGNSFPQSAQMFQQIMYGRTLGEAMSLEMSPYTHSQDTGFVFGDPLYQPVAAAIYTDYFSTDYDFSIQDDTCTGGGKMHCYNSNDINSSTPPKLYINAMLGRSKLEAGSGLSWEIRSCRGHDIAECDDTGTGEDWGSVVVSDTKAAYGYYALDLEDAIPNIERDDAVVVRLKVSDTDSDTNDIYAYYFFEYDYLPPV